MADASVFLTTEGFDFDYVCDLDLLSFNKLHESVLRTKLMGQLERANLMAVSFAASQSKEGGNAFEKAMKDLQKRIPKRGPELDQTDTTAFIARFGGGI